MESEAKYTLVGAVVIGMAALVVFAAVWISRGTAAERTKLYTIYFHNQNLSGLQESSWVTMRGIKIGSVKDVRISKRNIEHVKVTVATDETAPIKADTEAVIYRNLLTGIASIDLVKSSNDAPLLQDVTVNEQYPVIKEGKSDFERIADSVPDLLNKVEASLARINILLDEKNVEGVSETIGNLRMVSDTLAQSNKDIARLLKSSADLAEHSDKKIEQVAFSLTKASDKIAAVVEEFGKSGTTMTKSMQGSLAVIAQQISDLSQKLADAANNVSATSLQYQDPRAIITGPAKGALGPGEHRQ